MTQTHQTSRRAWKSPEARLRCRVHQLGHDLKLCEGARRGISYCVVGKRYAREMNLTELEILVAWLERELRAKERPPYSEAELSRIVNAESLDELLGA
jgi:hypothetical protein